MDWGGCAAVENLPSMYAGLDSVPSAIQEQGQGTPHIELKQLLCALCLQQWQVGVVGVWR